MGDKQSSNLQYILFISIFIHMLFFISCGPGPTDYQGFHEAAILKADVKQVKKYLDNGMDVNIELKC